MILLGLTLALWLPGLLLRARLRRTHLRNSGASADRVSVIIPARNEERNLPKLLQSLAAQPVKPREVLVVDDASTDATAEVARRCGARVITLPPLPDGWRGKTWGCHHGAKAAAGELLLFLDADTWFEPDGFERLLAAYPGGAFSAGPHHAVERPHEQLSLCFNLCMAVGTIPDRLFGPMLLVDRVSYDRVGGHAVVKGRILENLTLADRFREAGVSVRSVTGRGMLAFRMYPDGLRDVVDGWTKAFAAGAGQTPGGILWAVIAWMSGLMFSWLGGLLTGDWAIWAPVYVLGALQVGWLGRRVGAFGWYAAALFPVPLLFFFGVFARSALRSGRTVTWKGRAVHAD